LASDVGSGAVAAVDVGFVDFFNEFDEISGLLHGIFEIGDEDESDDKSIVLLV